MELKQEQIFDSNGDQNQMEDVTIIEMSWFSIIFSIMEFISLFLYSIFFFLQIKFLTYAYNENMIIFKSVMTFWMAFSLVFLFSLFLRLIDTMSIIMKNETNTNHILKKLQIVFKAEIIYLILGSSIFHSYLILYFEAQFPKFCLTLLMEIYTFLFNAEFKIINIELKNNIIRKGFIVSIYIFVLENYDNSKVNAYKKLDDKKVNK